MTDGKEVAKSLATRRLGAALLRGMPYVVVLGVGIALSLSTWTNPVRWTTDGLFYEAKAREFRGATGDEALRSTFFGAAGDAAREHASSSRAFARNADEEWIRYSARFYERRVLVPALAAAIYPVFGERSVLVISLVAYLLAGLLVYVLLRRRASIAVSLALSCAVLLLQPFREWSFYPLTDSLSVALVAGCLLTSMLVLEHGQRWLPAWGLAVFALLLTREVGFAVAGAAIVVWVATRTRQTLALACVAAVAVVAAGPILVQDVPLREWLAYGFSGNTIPSNTSWSFVLGSYWPNLEAMLNDERPYVLSLHNLPAVAALAAALFLLRSRRLFSNSLVGRAALLFTLLFAYATLLAHALGFRLLDQDFPYGAAVLAGVATVLVSRPRTPFDVLARAMAVATILLLLVFPQARGFRAELALVPLAALGVAQLSRSAAASEVSADYGAPRPGGRRRLRLALEGVPTRRLSAPAVGTLVKERTRVGG